MYLSNAEKEALWLTGYGDCPPWAVQEGLEQALARGSYVPGEESLRLRLADALGLEERLAAQRTEEVEGETALAGGEPAVDWEIEDAVATTEVQEAAEEPLADQWRSPLEIVTEGAEEPEQEPPGEGDAAPAAVAQRIEDGDFSSFTKAQLLAFAATFGVQLKRTDPRDELIVQVQRLVDEANGTEV